LGTSWKTSAIKALARRYRGHVPAPLRSWIRSKLGAQRFDRLKGEMESTLFSSAVDWEETTAYALGAGGNIYLNVAGREPSGIVEPGRDYAELRHDLARALSTIRDPKTDEELVARVWSREEAYEGPFLSEAPDLVIEWADYGYWGRGRYDIRNTLVLEEHTTLDFTELPLTGTHRPEGMFIISGRDVTRAKTLQQAHIADVAPTILSILGVPVPKYVDGRVIEAAPVQEQVGIDDAAEASSVVSAFAYTQEESEEISRRLENLGYL
jgi:predicted AlkP superfamily phosphohydrolase/phosphomutase